MRLFPNQRGWLPSAAILLMCCLLASASACHKKEMEAAPIPGQEWIDDMRKRADKVIADPDKKRQLIGLIDQEENNLRELHQVAQDYFTDLNAVDRNYDATIDDFRKVFSDYAATRRRLRDRSIDTRFQMQALVTAQEWEQFADISKRKGLLNQVLQYPAKYN